jgi:hypothetical protein
MQHYNESTSFPTRRQESFYVFTSFVGGLIRRSSLLVLILWFGLAAATTVVGTAKSFWHHTAVRSIVAVLESKLATIGSSVVDLKTEPEPHVTDIVKVQREENRARRKLANELRQRKTSASSIKTVRQHGSRI